MLEQLSSYFEGSVVEQGVNAGLEFADSFGPWGRTAAFGITLAATAGTTLLMMNKCRAKPAKSNLKASQTLTDELRTGALATTSTVVETTQQDEHLPSEDDLHQGPTTTKLSSSSSSSSSSSESESDNDQEHSEGHQMTAEELAAQERRNSLRSRSGRK